MKIGVDASFKCRPFEVPFRKKRTHTLKDANPELRHSLFLKKKHPVRAFCMLRFCFGLQQKPISRSLSEVVLSAVWESDTQDACGHFLLHVKWLDFLVESRSGSTTEACSCTFKSFRFQTPNASIIAGESLRACLCVLCVLGWLKSDFYLLCLTETGTSLRWKTKVNLAPNITTLFILLELFWVSLAAGCDL